MAAFPLLNSGAVTQYPTALVTGQGVQVIRFIDGMDQRSLLQGKQFRRWQIRLDLLNDSELQQMEAFFIAQQGDYSPFSFPDPFTGTNIPNCRMGAPILSTEYTGVDTGATFFWVIETNG